MTVCFRPVKANELVDDERAAQRIYMGSAMTMEQGELAPISSPMQMQLPAAYATPPTSATNHPILSTQPRSFSPQLPAQINRLRLPVVHCELPRRDARNGPFCFSFYCHRTTIPAKHLPSGAV